MRPMMIYCMTYGWNILVKANVVSTVAMVASMDGCSISQGSDVSKHLVITACCSALYYCLLLALSYLVIT